MSFQNMTADELKTAIREFQFAKPKPDNVPGRQSSGFTEVGYWLGTQRGGDRIGRMARGINDIPAELAYLLRLMWATGYTPEMVEALPPITTEAPE